MQDQHDNEPADGHKKRQAKKRAEIIAAATEIFFREGYGRTSMDRVLAAVGGSKRTLYNHFGSKEILFKAIVEQVSNRVLAALTPQFEAGSLRETLIGMATSYLKALTTDESLSLYRAMVSEAEHFPDLAHNFFQNGPGYATSHLADYLRTQADRGLLKVPDPDLASAQFLGMIRGNIHLLAVLNGKSPSEKDILDSATAATNRFLHGCVDDKAH